MVVYAFEWCSCVYESGFSIESLHTTKAGAYRAMRKALQERWEDRVSSDPYWRRLKNPLDHESWRIREVDVQH